MPKVTSLSFWGGNVAWVVVYLANLVVPLWLGWEITSSGGQHGMVAATALMLLLTLLVVPRWSELRMTLVAGSTLTAISQAVPLVQIVVGILSLQAVHYLGFVQEGGYQLTEPGGFLAAILTACMMLAAAFKCGVFIRAVGRAKSWVSRCHDWPGPPADWQIQRKLRERHV